MSVQLRLSFSCFLIGTVLVGCQKKKDGFDPLLLFLFPRACPAGGSVAATGTPRVPCDVDLVGSKKGEPGNIQDNMFQSLAVDPTDSNTIFLSGFLHDSCTGAAAQGLIVSSDGGQSWRAKNPSPTSDH